MYYTPICRCASTPGAPENPGNLSIQYLSLCSGKERGHAVCIAQKAYPLGEFNFFGDLTAFRRQIYLTLMLTTVLKTELAELFTLLTAFTL